MWQNETINTLGSSVKESLVVSSSVLVGFGFFFKLLINTLLGFVRSLAFIVHLQLFKVHFNGFSQKFFKILLVFVTFDAFDLSDYYDNYFELENNAPNA